ncbi:MAG: DsbA family protein [Anaerolineae bacterium]
MAKSSRSRSGSARYRRRKREQAVAKWLPWAIAAAIILMIAALVARRLMTPQSPGDGPREEEWLSGVTGLSYDAGTTDYIYPDPAGLGEGHRWLPALGEPTAPVTVIEFSDIFCGHCREYNLESLPDLLEDYVATGDVRYVDHYYGFAETVQQGIVMAEMCAAEQGRYFEFKHALFQTIEVGGFDIERAARVAGVDPELFSECRDEERYAPALQESAFVENMGVNSTPTFFINGERISGNRPLEIRAMIDAALAAP